MLAGEAALDLDEGLEDLFEALGRNADTGVLDDEIDRAPGGPGGSVLIDRVGGQGDAPAVVRELDGVDDEVDEDLLDALGIAAVAEAVGDARVEPELLPLGLGSREF